MRDTRDVVDRLGHRSTQLAQAVEVVGERAGLELWRASRARARHARAPRRAPPSTRSRSTTTAPSASSTTTSPWRIVAPPTSTGSPIAPGRSSPHRGRGRSAPRSAGRARAARRRRAPPRRRAARATPRPFACVASSSPTSATGAGSGIVSTSTSPGSRLRDGRVHHEVVALAAVNGARRAGGAGARHDLDQRHVDDRRPSGRLVDVALPLVAWPASRSGAGPAPRTMTAHTDALTTCGVTRWNASAYRIAESPDERRAWLPRCSARCV